MRKTAACSCVAKAASIHDEAYRKHSSDSEDRRTIECECGGQRQHDRWRARL